MEGMTYKERERIRKREWHRKHREHNKAYGAEWRKAHPEVRERENARRRAWQLANPDKVRAQRRAWLAKNPGASAKWKRLWWARHPEKAKAYAKAKWLRIIDSYELHEAHMLKQHNRRYPDKPYRPNYKARRPPTWMMHRALWEYAGGEPTPEQRAYALALFRSRRAQRFGLRENVEM